MGGILTAFLAFEAGGFFPGSLALVAVVLALALVARLTLAGHPAGGWSRTAAVVAGAAALFASWILLSALWSNAPARALIEFDRALAYVLAFAFYATFPRRPGTVSSVLRWVLLAMVAAAVAGLATRLYPDVFEAVAARNAARLAYPLTYWNAAGVFCALGTVLALHAAAGSEEPPVVRVLATAALPVLVVAGYFSFSRGAIAVGLIGLISYALLAFSRRLLFALAVGAPAVAVALHVAYGADALATATYFRGDGPGEGHRVAAALAVVAIAAAIARTALLPLEARVRAVRIEPARRRALLAGAAVVAVVALALAAVVFDAPARAQQQYRGFVNGNVVLEQTDARARLGQSGNNGRLDIWGVAVDTFRDHPLRGSGAGTFPLRWEQARTVEWQIIDGHSLYLETLAELGGAGMLLLGVALLGILFALVRNLRGPERHAHAAVLAAGGALLVHAGLDWDWEMPALFLWLFAAGGAAAARPAGLRRTEPSRLTRIVAGLLCLALALTPALVARSQAALDRGVSAFKARDCTGAVDGALDSLDALSVRAEPYELIGYCDLRAGAGELAVRAMEAARARDPGAWQYAYGLAIARALAGTDPRSASAEARRLNPREPLAQRLDRALGTDRPARWRRAAAAARIPSQ